MKIKKIAVIISLSIIICLPFARGENASGKALSFQDCVSLALNNNVSIFLARARTAQARAEKISTRGQLLPQISLYGFQRRIKGENYGAGAVEIVKNFDFLDARVLVSQRILDLSALAESEAGNLQWQKARLEEALAKEEIIISTASAYIQALMVRGQVKAAKESVSLARHFLSLAQHQLSVGVGSQIDLARAKTELARQKARLESLELVRYRAKMELKRILRLPLAEDITLSDSLGRDSETWPNIDEALNTAMTNRLEIRAALEQISYRKHKLKAAEYKRLPKIEVDGEYGVSGLTPNENGNVGYAGITVSLPVWQGGSLQGQIEQQVQAKREDEIKLADLRQKIEEDVRLAYETLKSSRIQVNSRKEVVELAKRELSLAENRFKTGIGDNIEVVNAQTVLADAKDSYVQALGQYEQACLNLYGALGNAKDFSLTNG